MQTRHQMVRQQIQSRGISSPEVLQAMRRVKRHLFVPASLRGSAYADRPLPIGHGQTISQPFIVAFMTEALKIKKTDSVLEIGTGSGYQAAVLAEIANEVYSIEIIEELALTAQRVLKSLGYQNVTVKTGDGYAGWAEHAPFDAIIVTAAPEDIPQKLVDQLAEGRRMVIPVGTQFQELLFIEKTLDRVITTSLLPVRFVPMVHPNSKKEFPSKQPGTDFN